jgi:hypothetical protein
MKYLILILASSFFFTACPKKDPAPEPAMDAGAAPPAADAAPAGDAGTAATDAAVAPQRG